ncbi:hypothetical protein HJD18_12310 [Thermoleophilia bacterium SCSIO 60948]|nr:hypothetical protein HJD18_12310 [Thermoleophilia bacterium SCSIO 60948]
MKRLSSIVAASLAALAVAAPAAHGAQADSDITLKFKSSNLTFKGEVLSERGSCEKRRRVILFEKRPGKDRRSARTRTDHMGKYEIQTVTTAGSKYYAVAKGTRRCAEAKSKTVTS